MVAAKRLLAGVIDPGLPAGPSESIILADETVHGGLAALDLLIEAEHGPDSSAWLVTHSRQVAEEALAALPGHWAAMTPQRVEFSQAVLCGRAGGIVLTASAEESHAFVNDYAPEHLQILSEKPFEHLGRITEAAEVLMGPHTPITIANFCLGPNAVLPTSRGRAPGGRSRSTISCAAARWAMSRPPPIPSWRRLRSGSRNTRVSRPMPTPWARCATPI